MAASKTVALLIKEDALEDKQQASHSGWAIMGLNGHNREAGYMTTVYFGGPALFQIDVPDLEERETTLTEPRFIDGKFLGTGSVIKKLALPGRTVHIGITSVYRANWCSEELVRKALESTPRTIEIVKAVEQKELPYSTERLDQVDDEDDHDF